MRELGYPEAEILRRFNDSPRVRAAREQWQQVRAL
jgi:hypothetical protein